MGDVTGRKCSYSPPTALIRVIGVVLVAFALMVGSADAVNLCGISYKGGGPIGFGGGGNAPIWCRKTQVFKAAPLKTMVTVPTAFEFFNRYAPPPYLIWASLNRQSSQFSPSSCCAEPLNISNFTTFVVFNGTTFGTASGGAPMAACAEVDVWIPEETMNAQQAPTINDPNASGMLRIRPSPEFNDGSSGCTVWHYHYLKPGQKPPLRRTTPLSHP